MDNWFQLLVGAIFFFVIGSFIFRIFKNGGFKAAMFNQRIIRTVGSVSGIKQSMMGSTIKVHALGSGHLTQAVGLEFVSKSPLSYQMIPSSLSVAEAKRLITLLEAAVAEAEHT